MSWSATLPPAGRRVEITADPLIRGAFELAIDGSPQSHVRLDDPGSLFYDYVRRMGSVFDRIRVPGAPVTAVHLGAGALTLARYLQVTRPGSDQHVVELEPGLIDFVTERLPLPEGTELTVHLGDAARVVHLLGAAVLGADLVVADLYQGTTTPPYLRNPAFFSDVAKLLADDGVLLVNVADDDGAPARRAQVAALEQVFPHLLLLGPTSVLQDDRAGNAVIAASASDRMREWVADLRLAGPHPGLVIEHPSPTRRKDDTPCADASR